MADSVRLADTAKKLFAFLRDTTRLDDMMAKSIPVEKGDLGYLIPIGQVVSSNPHFNNRVGRFESVLIGAQDSNTPIDLQMSFLLVDTFGEDLGLASITVEMNGREEVKISHLRVIPTIDAGKLVVSLQTMLAWIEEFLNPERIFLNLEEASRFQIFQDKLSFFVQGTIAIYKPITKDLGRSEILTAGPSISPFENSYALDASRYGWNGEWSKYIKRFETQFAEYIGVNHALSTSSCTGALHLALLALGIGPEDEVIVPEITWVATASAAKYVGAKVVFCDVQKENWCMDPDSLESLITPKTKCIMPVHTYGHPCDMDRIMEIANRHNLFVVEDAAPAIGATCRGRKVGTYGHFAAFSFQGAKMLVTGEGGMLVCKDRSLFQKAYKIWDHGRISGTFWIDEVGVKYKMSNIQAALGLGQLERCEEQIKAKRKIAGWYQEEFAGFDGVQLISESQWARSIYWMNCLVVNPDWGVSRENLFKKLKEVKIDTRPAFPAISQYPMWKVSPKPTAHKIGEYGVNLPSGVRLREDQIRYVAKSIKVTMTELRK